MELASRPMFNHNNAHPQRDWRDRATSLSSAQPPLPPNSSPVSQRRRTSAAHVRPAGPPPNLPMPSIPASAEPPEPQYAQYAMYNHTDLPPAPYHRSAPSPNLTALATFSQSRQQQQQYQQHLQQHHSMLSPSEENLSDPPPPSFLPPPSSRTTTPASHRHEHDYNPDPNLLAPPEHHSGTSHRRPSPRRTLTKALELARKAVTIDATNDDPYAAVMAYGESVALLSEVMERVRRGEESTERRRSESNGRRRSIVAQEEEIRRLKSIHDTYADRMNILSLIYHIPPQPRVEGIYSVPTSNASTQPPSPTSSTSPTSDTATTHQLSPRTDAFYIDHPLSMSSEGYSLEENPDAIGVAMFEPQSTLVSPIAISPAPNYHPFSSRHESQPQPAVTSHRSSVIGRRPRALSNLPPPPPPPAGSPPPPPVSVVVDVAPDVPASYSTSRSRSGSVNGHHRNGSGSRLESLREETERFENIGETMPSPSPRHSVFQDLSRHTRHESHPLPPIPDPSPTSSDGATPRTDIAPTATTSRPRGSSIRSTYDAPQLINTSTTMGTISQRRMKASTPPIAPLRPSSPTESTESHGSVGSVPASSSQPSGGSIRTRAASQPGRRPSVIASFEQDRPPLPATAGVNGSHLIRSLSSRKSKPPPPPLPLISTDPLPTGLPPSAGFLAGNAPLTPTSPLPPAPPSDPLRKPYHLMHLLRITIVSQSGGYLTRRLHVPQEVWSQGGAKLNNLGEKVKVVEILCASLEDLATTSSEYFGAGNVGSGLALGIGSISRKEGEAWVAKLDEFSGVCESIVGNFGKKLGVGEGFVTKKSTMTSWGGKLSRRLDKLTNTKNLDSPAAYVQGLKQLFLHAQLLDEHTKAVLSSTAGVYDAMPNDVRIAAETKLRRSSEFFASVVLTFVIRDLSQLLDKYAKKCEKWLAE